MSVRFVFSKSSGDAAGSGLTGDPDLGAAAPPPPGGRARPFAALAGTVRVLRLVWGVDARLTGWLGAAIVVAGLVPVVTAATVRVLVNAVLAAVAGKGGGPLDVRLPGFAFDLPAMPTGTAVVVLVAVQFTAAQLGGIAAAMRSGTQQLLQERVTQDVRARIMDHAAGLELAFFERGKSYDLLRQAQQEAAIRPVGMVSSAFGLLQNLIMFTGLAVLLVTVSPWLALLALLAPVPAFIADARHGTQAFLLSTLAAPARRRMDYLSTLLTTDQYAKEVRLLGLGGYLTSRFRLIGDRYYQRLRTQVRRRQTAAALWGSLSTVVGAGTYLYIALAAVNGRLTLGDLMLYTAAALTLQAAIQAIFSALSTMHESTLYLDQLFALLAVRPQVAAGALPVGGSAPRITFDNVSFRYPDATEWALREVSFDLADGATTALVGTNGSGKSTVVKLVCGLYQPTEGRILIDGVDLCSYDPALLRSRTAAMFQDYVTYQATVRENVGLGAVDRIEDTKAVTTAMAGADALRILKGLPGGMETMLGRWFGRGTELSGGQWQRVALARAFMRPEATLLLLDEPSSALDARAEADLFTRLADLSDRRTVVYVSHRFSTVRHADQILVLDSGRLVETGTHTTLVDKPGGTYADLFRLQAAPFLDPQPD
ncbi:ABC transporter ATP-binding protein [Actinokineospora terrae]|uniref:ATP-binding cassette, subfamily B n=1 Tax=Actinokineospora terrae TaxID=155974 RepID=A0A1H9VIE0_9PSEU|nr:ABC transporter ATP-binding protein [Actinokineospora terrae]SES21017.1 ATP-binding cassette, subfamily B [Actinokineospora terrae]